MATKETIWDMVSSMASVWTFPGNDLKATAAAYYQALRDLSDDQIMDAATALLASWQKASPPKPADIRVSVAELRISSPRQPRLPRPEPDHDEILHRIKCQTYHVRAITDVLGEERRHLHHSHWTASEWKAISKRQAELRSALGLEAIRA